MNKATLKIVKNAIQNLTGNDFQDFIDCFYLIIHKNNFQPIKQKRDKGCDGIINNEIVLAVYAPEKYELKNFKKKYQDDFDSYRDNLSKKYPKWQIVYNRELTTGNFLFLKGLKSDVITESIKSIMNKVEFDLNWTQRSNIFDQLGIDRDLWNNDIFIQVTEDLIKEHENDNQRDVSLSQHKSPKYIEEKININFDKNDVDMAKRQYDLFLENGDFDRLQIVLSSLEEKIVTLKGKILRDFMETNEKLTFKERLKILIDKYSQRRDNDDTYKQAVTVVLIYYFEYCLIGRKTEGE